MFDTKPRRAFYVPKGALKVTPKGGGAVFYLYERPDQRLFFALGFVGRAQKPTFHYRFASEAKRTAYLGRVVEGIRAREERKARDRAERSKPHGWEAGLILKGSWGYEQTNVDFFEVVRVVGKTMVEIEEIGAQQATDAPDGFAAMSDHVVPNPEARSGRKHRVKVSHGACRSPKHGILTPWNGKPAYCSWYH